jgi:acid phosphatase
MLNFLIIGDWGRKGTPGQCAVADGMAQIAEQQQSRFVVTTGDNFYDRGVSSVCDAHWRESFEGVYTSPALHIPWYVVLGNHDYHGSIQAQIDYGRYSPRWYLPARYYAVERKIGATATALLVFLDTSPFVANDQVDDADYLANLRGQHIEAQLAWLEATLAASKARCKLVFGHHPIYSASPFHGDTIELQQHVLPLLHAYRVEAYICGHEHDLQHLEVDGMDYLVCGAGAEWRETGWRDHSRCSVSTLGFSAASLTADHLRFEFYNDQGQCLYDAGKPLCPVPEVIVS